jgi:PAS domain S-box-containing protein
MQGPVRRDDAVDVGVQITPPCNNLAAPRHNGSRMDQLSLNFSPQTALAVRTRTLRAAMRGLLHGESAPVSEREVKLQLARLREAVLEGLAICDSADNIAYVNDYLSHMLGRTREELLGKPARSWFGDMYAGSLLTESHADSGVPSHRYEAELRSRDGSALVVEVSVHRIESVRGRYVGSFAVLKDITARASAQAALRRSESDLRLLSAQLWAAQELERQRIARELHDGIGQALGGIKFGLENCGALLSAGSANAALENIHQLTGMIRSVVEELRRISMNLRPSTLDDLGILATLGWFSREFRSIYRQFHLETIVDVREEEIAPEVKTAIYRIVQEAVNNIVTHSHARNIWLTMVSQERRIELRIRDDGAGFDPRNATPEDKAPGLGLTSMRERAEATGGRFRVESQSGSGTTVLVTWPCHRSSITERQVQS